MSELNIGGSNMTVELRDDTNTLYAKANTGNKQWVAVVTDTHPKYNYDRDFAAYQKSKTSNRDSGTATIEEGDVIERVRYTHSGKNRKDRFYQLVDGEAHQIDEVDVEAALEGEIIPDVDDDDDDGETHTCEECGDEFDSAHGLAVHEGMVHNEDETENDDTTAAAEIDTDQAVVADGGLDIKDFRDVQHSDELVRKYSTPPGDKLYAYRSDDGEHHIVVSRGDEPRTRWEKRVPATRQRVVPGQKLWTIPDNWDKRAYSRRDNIGYALYYLPETDLWVKVSVPTNNWLIDAFYSVKAVGEPDVDYVGEMGSDYEVRQLADEYEENYDAEGVEQEADALRALADNWDTFVEMEYDRALDYIKGDGPWQNTGNGEYAMFRGDWTHEGQERAFRPGEGINRILDVDLDREAVSYLVDELKNADLIPNHYRVTLSIDEDAVGMEYYTRALVEAGCSAAAALDYHMVEIAGMSQTAWAGERGVGQSTVSGNVSDAEDKLGR